MPVSGWLTYAIFFLAYSTQGRRLRQTSSRERDREILNFALNLHYVEAEFYSCAAFGLQIPDDLRGGGPNSRGCQRAALSKFGQAIVTELAENDIDHVRVLRQELGDAAVPIPQLDIGDAFVQAGQIAFGRNVSPPFSPYLDDISLYEGAFIFEDVGVTALQDLLLGIQHKRYSEILSKILAVEGYHGGVIRTLLYYAQDMPSPYNIPVHEVVQQLALVRGKVGAGNGYGILNEGYHGNGSMVVAADHKGMGYIRQPHQVVAIYTLGAGSSGGGFFPDGLTSTLERFY